MPLLHVLMYLLINYLYIDKNNKLEELANRLEEYRMLPLPYGLLANELIQVIDQERVMPGISWIQKFAEDYPWVDHHSTQKEKYSIENPSQPSYHQHVFVSIGESKGNTLLNLFKKMPCSDTKEVPFTTYNLVRYTFIANLYKANGLDVEEFDAYLSNLQSTYIWNMYKTIISEYFSRSQKVAIKERKEEFKKQVLLQIRETLKQKVHINIKDKKG